MELVEYDQRNAFETGVTLQAACQDTFRHHFDTRHR